MPSYANFSIPFLGGGPTIAEQILQGLHEGFTEKQQKQELAIKQQQVSADTQRSNILNQLTQAQIQHEALQNAYEQETEPIRKQLLLNQLTESTAQLGMRKHIAKYLGFDLEGIEKGAAQDAAQPKPTAGEPQPPSMFEQELQKTKKALGNLAPSDEGQIDDAIRRTKEAFLNTGKLDTSHITAAIAAINTRKAERERAELETTPFKTWQAEFTKEHGRGPTAKEVQDFQTAGAAMRIQGLENLRQDNYLDTSQPGGVMSAMTSGEFAAANKAEPGRYVKATGQAINAVKATGLINDIRDGVKQMRDANAALPDKGLSSKARALMTLAAKNPETAVNTVMSGLAAENLSEPEQNYLIAHATLAERAMAMRGLQGQGAGSDQQRAAIVAMLPGFATADKKMAEKQLKTFENNVANLDRTIPKVGKMSRQSAGESAPPEESGVTLEDLLKAHPPKKP